MGFSSLLVFLVIVIAVVAVNRWRGADGPDEEERDRRRDNDKPA